MTAFDDLTTSQKLRASLHRDVRAICTESLHLLGLEMTKPAMEIIAELVYRKLSVYGTDLEAFAKHAKRNTVNADDVKLMVRRNPSIKSLLNRIQPSNPQTKDKRRKTVASITKQLSTPIAKEDIPRPSTEIKRTEPIKNSTEDLREETEDKTVEQSKNVEEASSKDDDWIERGITSEVEQMQMSVDATIDLTFD